MNRVLVAGATGGVGKRVVSCLLNKGYSVTALIRDAEKAKDLLGKEVKLFEADITIPETLKPEMMVGVTSVICCTGTKVQPVEGDTTTREKYYQGIKFYLPEVADSPEQVEYRGIKNLVEAVARHLPHSTNKVIFDFADPAVNIQDWGIVNDGVMGGVSQSKIRLADGKAVFAGIVSTDNNGGFASTRTRNFDPPFDLSEYEGIELKVTGDGSRYKFILRSEDNWDGIGYSYSFDTIHDFSTTVRIPFKELIPVFRAKTVSDAKLDTSKIYAMQLMLSKFEYDGELNPKFEAGNFGLQVEYIQAYGGKTTPQLVMISSAGVTRPDRPEIDLESQPLAVRMNEQLGGILTWKLRGEEVIKGSKLTYTIIRPCALTEKAGDKILYVEQGDNLTGQVSREAIAQLCTEAITLPEAVNKTFEISETENVGKTNWRDLLSKLSSDR